MLIFVKIKMNTFFQALLLFILLQNSFNSVTSSEDNLLEDMSSEDYWNWIFGETSDNKEEQSDHIKEEIGLHYGIKLPSLQHLIPQQEMDFHVFNFHDFDKNQLLDGLEMLSMMAHKHDDHQKQTQDKLQNILQSKHNSYLRDAAIIDAILRKEDINNDGFLTFEEFKIAKSKHQLRVFHN